MDKEYLYAHTGDDDERARLRALESENDPRTIRVLENLGVGPGWRCLEVGAGAGSIAQWLADRVGSEGHVVATDLDPRFLETLRAPNLEVRRHDILRDPLEPEHYDLVHSRFVLEHLREDDAAIDAMLGALKPGGVFVAEDVDFVDVQRGDHILRPAEAAPDFVALWTAVSRMAEERGIPIDYGRQLPIRLEEHGLLEVGAIAERHVVAAGSVGAEVSRRSMLALKDGMVASGFGDDALFARVLSWLGDPRSLHLSPMFVAAWGRKPG